MVYYTCEVKNKDRQVEKSIKHRKDVKMIKVVIVLAVYAIIFATAVVAVMALAAWTENHDPFHIKEKAEKKINRERM